MIAFVVSSMYHVDDAVSQSTQAEFNNLAALPPIANLTGMVLGTGGTVSALTLNSQGLSA
jgi:hypothetical protein